jgi:class 3 adenylate cyclase/YHS domain-containing protein
MEATFGFLDLAGFSALTETHGDERAADLVERFATLVRQAFEPTGRLVKTIGDAALVTAPEPASAIHSLQRLIERVSAEVDFPSLRAGFHHGSAVERATDVYGSAVNLAARVAARARDAEVLATGAVADAARKLGVAVTSLGPCTLKNIRAPVELFALDLMVDDGDMTIDPVCRMRVSRHRAAGRLRHDGRDHWFCSLDCVALFAASPQAYAR